VPIYNAVGGRAAHPIADRADETERPQYHTTCHVMVDKMTTVARSKLRKRVGELADEEMVRVNRAVVVFLGLAGVRRNENRRSRAAGKLPRTPPSTATAVSQVK
jgi:hypothetical protein